ncbi:transcriptional regulator [Nocardia sp. alder85J]|uniref:transcriptional regulator n=1 Tax=Nocardia sp. alder85J TaxID=2862949 RepID=UPI001CD1E40A|nr:transcriptional regulator [Nocardia sp. alder85J]MCX4096905.1 transcriptional regulator [Nocardia sp. alder85J]
MTQRSSLSRRRAALEREWTRWVPASAAPAPPAPDRAAESGVRREVAQSWLRSMRTVDPETTCAPDDSADIGSRWAASPLRGPVTALTGQLHSIAHDAGYIAAVTDADGTILWSYGGTAMRRRAEQVNFAPGGRWDEAHMGTNALSLALRTGAPSTVFSAEHLVAALHGWVCYCAPIHAADGRRLGVLDLSASWDRSNPLAMSTVRTLVSAIETQLRADTAAAPGTDTGIRLSCLGAAGLTRDGRPVRVRPRQLEILALLALEPGGFTRERLHHAIYGDRPAGSSTLKADVSHLRRATGGEIATRVYQLTTPLSCDAADLVGALSAGDTDTAVRLYRGPLLPGSDTPGIVEWRDHLAVGVRAAVLADPDPAHALHYGDRVPDDIAVHEHALRLLPADDARRAVAVARLHTALRR